MFNSKKKLALALGLASSLGLGAIALTGASARADQPDTGAEAGRPINGLITYRAYNAADTAGVAARIQSISPTENGYTVTDQFGNQINIPYFGFRKDHAQSDLANLEKGASLDVSSCMSEVGDGSLPTHFGSCTTWTYKLKVDCGRLTSVSTAFLSGAEEAAFILLDVVKEPLTSSSTTCAAGNPKF